MKQAKKAFSQYRPHQMSLTDSCPQKIIGLVETQFFVATIKASSIFVHFNIAQQHTARRVYQLHDP